MSNLCLILKIMKKILKYLPLAFLLFLLSCSDSPEQKLKSKIVHALRDDNALSENEWREIASFVENNVADYADFLQNGKINSVKLDAFIQANAKVNRAGETPTIFQKKETQKGSENQEIASAESPKVQVFLENSWFF